MFPPRPTELLQTLLKDLIRPGDLVIDATAGNGHDTAFLAEAVGPEGRVIAVDIQEQAVLATERRLEDQNLRKRVEIYQTSHTRLGELAVNGSVSLVVFNLGYLPGGDHSVITESENTIAAITSSIRLMKPEGILAVTCYPGHAGGDRESEAVERFLEGQEHLRLAKYAVLSTAKASPFLLLAATKRPRR